MRTGTRTIDPDVAKARSVKANAVKAGDIETAERATRELDRAKRVAAIRAAVKNAPPLDPDVRDSIVNMLHAAGGSRAA